MISYLKSRASPGRAFPSCVAPAYRQASLIDMPRTATCHDQLPVAILLTTSSCQLVLLMCRTNRVCRDTIVIRARSKTLRRPNRQDQPIYPGPRRHALQHDSFDVHGLKNAKLGVGYQICEGDTGIRRVGPCLASKVSRGPITAE